MGSKDNRPTDATADDKPKTNSTSTGSTGNSRGRGRGTGTGAGAAGDAEKPSQKSLGISDVKTPVSIDVPGASPGDDKPKQGRGRPKGTTKKPQAKKKAAEPVNPQHFKLLLRTVSGVIASRPGMEVFMLSDQEAEQIASPLAAIMSKNEALGEFAGEYADHIALLIACATIFIPKVLMYQHIKKQQQPQLPQVEKDVTTNEHAGPTTGNATNNVRENRNTGHVQDDGYTFSGTINSLISPIAGI